jgi:hypothetical protein
MESAEKIAENEATFRDANEAIERRAQELDYDARIPFICECGDGYCREITRLSYDEYEQVRGEPTQFLVVPGHEAAAGSSGRVVRRADRFFIVEKIGAAGDIAAERDPRATAD